MIVHAFFVIIGWVPPPVSKINTCRCELFDCLWIFNCQNVGSPLLLLLVSHEIKRLLLSVYRSVDDNIDVKGRLVGASHISLE